MYDKQIRRRRAVLALLVVISLILLTDYFGESSSSPLHSVQRGIATVLSPVQEGASTVLSPFRGAAGYVSSLFTAKSKLASLQNRYDTVVRQYAQLQLADIQDRKAAALLKLDTNYSLKQYGPVHANVIDEDPSLWYETITVDKGSDAGVRQWDPVLGPGGLIGDVNYVTSNESVVSLITSPKFSVGAEIENNSGAGGSIQPQVGNPNTLELVDLPTNSNVFSGELVVTNGFQDPKKKSIESIAPQGIPIGTVSSTNAESTLLTDQQVQVTPLADLQHLSLVQILTHPRRGA